MGTVIGPISKDDFWKMNVFRGNIKFYKQTDRVRYADALEMETKAYKETLSSYLYAA